LAVYFCAFFFAARYFSEFTFFSGRSTRLLYQKMKITQGLIVLLSVQAPVASALRGYLKYDGHIDHIINSPLPSDYLRDSDLPQTWDWRNVNGTYFAGRVLNQKNPHVCGSCWAQAATGALTDRYIIATNGKFQATLAPQNLLNFRHITGGTCDGGDADKAYEFINKYGITDDTCTPYFGMDNEYGFEISDNSRAEDVSAHQCWSCTWATQCFFLPPSDYNLYHADEFGTVLGEQQMMSEIYARGPIACSLNSEAPSFNAYRGGIITVKDPKYNLLTDHVVVIAGYGVDAETGMKYWVGRNSYGTQWGEGPGGGWFRLERGVFLTHNFLKHFHMDFVLHYFCYFLWLLLI
jgi:cathepsin X